MASESASQVDRLCIGSDGAERDTNRRTREVHRRAWQRAKTTELPSALHAPPPTVAGTDIELDGFCGRRRIDDPCGAGGAEVGSIVGRLGDGEELVGELETTWLRGRRAAIDAVECAVDGPVGLERSEIEAREVLLVVDPGGVDLRVLLLLLAGGLGIVRPESEVLSVVADGETGNIDGLRFSLRRPRAFCRLSSRSIQGRAGD